MRQKTDSRAEARVSATEASRSFSKLLDRVERGRRFVVRRHGRDVCVIAPPSQVSRRASDCLLSLRNRSAVTLDGGFGKDLMAVLAEETIEEQRAWES